MKNNVAQILLVEDDANLGFLIQDSLNSHGWNVHLFSSGEKGITGFHNYTVDICILDVMLPEKNGFTVAEEIRRYNQQVPIIFLTAKNQAEDRIKGFQLGADDYVTKPFSMEELKYRIEAILKRSAGVMRASEKPTLLHAGNSVLDIHNLQLNANKEITRLTHKEGRLLQMFFRHLDKLIERDVFLKAIWEGDGFFAARSMDVFVSKLRKYIKNDPSLRIENVRGIGYILKRV